MTAQTDLPPDSALAHGLDAYGARAARRRRTPGAAEVLGCTAAAGGLAFAGGDAVGASVHDTAGTAFSVASGTASAGLDIDGAADPTELGIAAYRRRRGEGLKRLADAQG